MARNTDDFFTKNTCDRCSATPLIAKIMSWFTAETICMECSAKEDTLKQQMRQAGMDPGKYEGCGYIPEIPAAKEAN